jgi:hypothetical protein
MKPMCISLYDVKMRPGSDGETVMRRLHGRIRGGAYRDRTGDLLIANQALSQLS